MTYIFAPTTNETIDRFTSVTPEQISHLKEGIIDEVTEDFSKSFGGFENHKRGVEACLADFNSRISDFIVAVAEDDTSFFKGETLNRTSKAYTAALSLAAKVITSTRFSDNKRRDRGDASYQSTVDGSTFIQAMVSQLLETDVPEKTCKATWGCLEAIDRATNLYFIEGNAESKAETIKTGIIAELVAAKSLKKASIKVEVTAPAEDVGYALDLKASTATGGTLYIQCKGSSKSAITTAEVIDPRSYYRPEDQEEDLFKLVMKARKDEARAVVLVQVGLNNQQINEDTGEITDEFAYNLVKKIYEKLVQERQ